MIPCPAQRHAVCGRLSVPEDRSHPEGRQIEMSVQVFPAADPTPAPDAVFFVAGGPGDASTDIWSVAPAAFPKVHAHRDIVLVDQRGTGDSNPMWVPESPDLSGMSRKDAVAAFQAWLDDYLAGLDAEPELYGSSQAADDLDDVRAALGYDRIDLYGGSYGATLIQYYVRQHEDHVRAIVLDGGTLLDVPVLDFMPRNSQQALDSVFERCAADPECSKAFPDPAGELEAAMARLASDPVETDVVDPWTDQRIVVNDDALAGVIHGLLAASAAADVPLTIHQAATGDIDAIAERIKAASQDPATTDDRELMYWVITCSEGWSRLDPAEVARIGEGSYALHEYMAWAEEVATSCPFAPKASLVPGDDEPLRSDVPVLLLNGAEDPQDPPSNVADAPVDLPNSLAIAPVALGHVVGYMGCLPDVVDAFLEAGSVADLDTSCVETMPVAPFTLP